MQNSPSGTVLFRSGETIFEEQSPCDSLFIIQEGTVDIFRRGKGQGRVRIATVGSGEYLGEMALFRGTPHSSTAIAASDVTAVKLSRQAIESQLKTAPSWLVALTRGLVMRLHQANEIIRKTAPEELSSTDDLKKIA